MSGFRPLQSSNMSCPTVPLKGSNITVHTVRSHKTVPMEGEPETSDEDVQEENKPIVLWEKCIQQSIFVDLSEDESLHFSDLDGSLNLHLSQAESAASESSIRLSENAELSPLDDTSSECSVISSQSDRAVEKMSKSSQLHMSAQRPNTTQEDLPLNRGFEDPGQNTSDEDQEDLPFDNDLGSLYFKQTVLSEGNRSSDGRETVHASPEVLQQSYSPLQQIENTSIAGLVSIEHDDANPATLLKEDVNTKEDNSCGASKPNKVVPSWPSPVDINQMLLRHFSQDELLRSGRLIEAETLPEVSLLESVDDTVCSLAQTHKSPANNSNHSESHTCHSESSQSFSSGTREETKNDASNNSSSDERTQSNMDYGTASADSNESSEDNNAVDLSENKRAERVSQFVRTRSFSDIKYGQGQVHYPLPDFSKVAPKVKIPKAPNGSTRPAPQSSSLTHRTQSSPGMLDVISRVLEDSVLPSEKPYVFNHEDKETSPALVRHLQNEYDKLLTRYAEAENLIDQMRLGTNQDQLNDDDDHEKIVEGNRLGSMTSHLPPSGFVEKGTTAPQSHIKEVNKATQAEDGPSDGERMTAELSDISSQFIQKVNEFKLSLSKVLVSTGEQQMMLRTMMEAQDQLERKYRSKKEEHRALEMQNYMGLSRNTGIFDPNRLVEGEIFRIGMHLEDIKEMIDKNVCEQILSPLSCSTPGPMKEMLHSNPNSLCISTTSPPTSLHEVPSAFFSAASCEMGSHKEVKGDKEVEETRMDHRDGGLEQSSKLISADSLLKHTGWNSCTSWNTTEFSGRSEEEGNEDENSSVLSKGRDHSNILAYLSGSNSTSVQTDWTPDSIQDGVLNKEGECVSLAVEISSSCATPRVSDAHCVLETPISASSRIVSPETDSGFGSSYLNQSGSQTNHHTESGLHSSDSEGSTSNLPTAIHSVSMTSQQWSSPHANTVPNQSSSAQVAVECWMEGTAKKPSERLQADKTGSDSIQPAPIQHHVATPTVRSTMDAETRHSQSCCSCKSEIILALQSEVSRLKKDLEEGLVQLPHLAQKMDYLTCKYKQGRQERRSKPRPRIHQKSVSNSPAKLDDWISSDMEASKSKVTDSGDTAESEIMLQYYSSPVGSSRDRAEFVSAPHQTVQSHRGTEGSTKTYSFTSFSLKRGKEPSFHSDRQRPQMPPMSAAIMDSHCSKERWSPLSTAALQKPLLQVNYGSSSSLPASYKVREPPLQSMFNQWKRSTQSDTALLPSNVYFQQTRTRASVPTKTGSRTGLRRGSKEDDMNRTLDQAIEVAHSMKRTTDRMAKRLSADLAKAQFYRKLHSTQPLGGRKHHAL